MVAAALPATKIISLVVKTLAKPVSSRIKHQFAKNKTTANGLIWIGQFAHNVESRLTIWSAGYKVRTINPLEESIALKNGSEVVGETFVLGISLLALLWEYNRTKEKEYKKEAEKHELAKQERDELQNKLLALDKRLRALEVVVEANNDSLLRKINRLPKYVQPKDVVSISSSGDGNPPNSSRSEQEAPIVDGINLDDRTDNNATSLSDATGRKNDRSFWRRWIWPF